MAILPPSGKRRLSIAPKGKQAWADHSVKHSRSRTKTAGRSQRRSLAPVLASDRALLHPTRFRLILVWLMLVAGMLALTLNLFRLQVMGGAVLHQRALAQQQIQLRPFVARRTIVDRLGNAVAIDRPAYVLYAHPALFKVLPSEVAASLAVILGQTPERLLEQFQQGETGIEIEYALSEETADRVQALGMDGLELVLHQQRLYPQQELFATVAGFVDVDRHGQAGVEQTHQLQLERPTQDLQLSRSGNGQLMPDLVPAGFVQADDLQLQLTLDSRLQRSIQTRLQQQIEDFSALRGTVIVMDVQDGSIPVMVTAPSYDPNHYNQADVKLFRNWALTDLYEPGSTFKPLNVAIALEDGSVKPDDVFYDDGQITIGEWTIQNHDFKQRGGRGSLSVSEIIKYSSNIGMVRIMDELKPEVYYNWLTHKLELDQPTNIDLPFEATGQLKSLEQFTGARVEPMTTSFGQGFSLTPLKLLQLQSMLANGGKLVTPHVVRGLIDHQGQMTWQPPLAPPKPVFSSTTTEAVLTMMEAVVAQGTGEAAQVAGYRIAGKTGTAQKADPNGGYLESARITSFVGIFPADAPRYAVLVVVDEPQGDDAYGSTVAAPVAKFAIERVIAAENILPTESIDPTATTPENSAVVEEEIPDEAIEEYSDWQETDPEADYEEPLDDYAPTEEFSDDTLENYVEESTEGF